jgi:hypothetical protein
MAVAVAAAAICVAAGFPAAGEAQEMASGAKWTLSLTQDYTASPWTSEVGYSNRAIGKLGFGVKNLLLGWTDLFVEPKEAMDGGENLLKGIGIGLKDAVENTLGGAVHLVTFPITAIDAPLPEGGTQLLG